MYLKILKDGKWIDTRSAGLDLLSFRKSSLSVKNEYESVEGKNGLIPAGTTWEGRDLTADFLIRASDHIDLVLLIDELMTLFTTKEEIGIVDSRSPGKVWFVKVDSTFTPEFVDLSTGKFTINFKSSKPWCRSIGRTYPAIDFENTEWQGLVTEPLTYKSKSKRFRIFNGGVQVDPREMPLDIIFKGASSNLQIINSTTGDLFTYKGTTKANDELQLAGIRHLKNGISIFAETNRKRITLAPGWNDIEIKGASGAIETSFDFHFWYV